MDQLELMANNLAFLTNDDLYRLSVILVRDYPARADSLEAQLNIAIFDSDLRLLTNAEMGS